MKKNMFNVIKLTVIIPMILTACNIGFYKVERVKATKSITPNYFAQKEYKIDNTKTNEEVVEETPVEETPIEVMAETNEVATNYEPTYEEPIVQEPVVQEPVVPETTTYYNYDYAYQVLYLINQIRRDNGLVELTIDYTLMEIANIRAEEATRNWSHTRPDGTNWWTLHQQYGLHGRFGENLAYGQEDPAEVVQAWMDSEGHRANILTPEFRTIGISAYNDDDVYYWSQEFAG